MSFASRHLVPTDTLQAEADFKKAVEQAHRPYADGHKVADRTIRVEPCKANRSIYVVGLNGVALVT